MYSMISGVNIPKQSRYSVLEFFILFLISVELIPYSKFYTSS